MKQSLIMLASKIYYLYKLFPALGLIFSQLCFPFKNISNTPIEFIHKGKQAKLISAKKIINRKTTLPELEKVFKAYGLVNVQTVDTTIIVNLKYAGKNNFLNTNMYGEIKNAYLQRDVCKKLKQASAWLKKYNPSYRLVILDAARPVSIQQKMWLDIPLPDGDREKFVSSPQIGSLHNFGAAVDVTIADQHGHYLDMGTGFDSFSDTAYTVDEDYLLKIHKLTQLQYQNRRLLRKIMQQSGFTPIETEWWHFNACSRNYAKAHYPLIVSHLLNQNPWLAQNKVNAPVLKKINTASVSFKIQLAMSKEKWSGKDKKFKGLDVNYYIHNGFYKYTTGNFSSLDKAVEMLDTVKQRGFTDAFIVAFSQNTRISVKDAIELIHDKNNH